MVYIFLADGFEETEAIVPIDILRRAGFEVTLAGVGGKTVVGSHGIAVNCDKSAEELTYGDDCQAVILPGGIPGTPNLKKSAVVKEFLTRANKDKKIVAAICAAPSILGEMGILNGKTATCYPGYENELAGADVSDAPCCISDNIVTARGAGVAFEFGLALADIISWKEGLVPYGDFSVSSKLEGSMQCDR